MESRRLTCNGLETFSCGDPTKKVIHLYTQMDKALRIYAFTIISTTQSNAKNKNFKHKLTIKISTLQKSEVEEFLTLKDVVKYYDREVKIT